MRICLWDCAKLLHLSVIQFQVTLSDILGVVWERVFGLGLAY